MKAVQKKKYPTNGSGVNGSRRRSSIVPDPSVASERARIVVVHVIPLICESLAQLFNRQPDLQCCGTANGPQEALALVEETSPQCVVTCLGLSEIYGLNLIRDLKAHHAGIRILVFSMQDEAVYAERVLHAGAHGYLHVAAKPSEILSSVRQVLRGDVYLSPSMALKFLNRFAHTERAQAGSLIDQLSNREMEIFELVGRGLGPQEIAKRLHLGIKTVDSYKTRIKGKLDLENARQLLQRAVEWVMGEQGALAGV